MPSPADNTPGDADLPVALVLGAAVWPGGEPSPTLLRRARHAADLYRTRRISYIVGCGGVGANPPPEAEAICRICQSEGVPGDKLHREDRSTSTAENIAFALPILQRIGTTRVAIVTDGYHVPRARLIARRFGLTCVDIPPPPSGPATLRQLRIRLREIPAYLWYLLRP